MKIIILNVDYFLIILYSQQYIDCILVGIYKLQLISTYSDFLFKTQHITNTKIHEFVLKRVKLEFLMCIYFLLNLIIYYSGAQPGFIKFPQEIAKYFSSNKTFGLVSMMSVTYIKHDKTLKSHIQYLNYCNKKLHLI